MSRAQKILLGGLFATLTGCSTAYVEKGEVESKTLLPFQEVVVFERNPRLADYSPRCIRVLKFSDPEKKDPEEIFRKAFHAQLSVTGVRLVPLQANENTNLGSCDIELRGTVLANDKTFLGVYSDYKAAVEIELFNVGQKEYFWRGKHEMSKKSGGLPLDPFSSLVGIFNASKNIGSDQDGKLAYELASRVVAKIPNLAYQVESSAPTLAATDKPQPGTEKPNDFLRRISNIETGKRQIEFRDYLSKNRGLSKADLVLIHEEWFKIDESNIEVGLRVLQLRSEADDHSSTLQLAGALEKATAGLNPSVFEMRSRTLLTLGRFEDASRDQLRAIALGKKTADNFFSLGKTYGSMGRYDLSVAALTKASELDPGNSDALLYLGVSEAALGNTAGSYEVLRKALVMNISKGDRPAALRIRAAMLNTDTYDLLSIKDKSFVEKTLQISTKEES